MRCLTAVQYARRATAGKYGWSEVQPSETAYSVLSEAKPEPECNVPKGWRELRKGSYKLQDFISLFF